MHTAMRDVPQQAWDALVPADAKPFLDWAFLDALEQTDCAVPERGWVPCHFGVWQGDRLVAAAPGYVKTHSLGEYMYNDFRWAEAARRSFGVDYYPKLILAVPFSPATGRRVLVAADADRAAMTRLVLHAAQELVRQQGWSSAHALFVRPDDLDVFEQEGWAGGAGLQFHWTNDGYRDFDAFLARFNSKRRHMIRSERAQLGRDGTSVRTLTGDALTEDVMAFVARCYEHTVDSHAWHAPHLTPAFFQQAARRLPGQVEVVLAEEGGKRLGAAFNLRGATRLYGRHWGAVEDRRFLHFNVCYYHSIERAIELGLEAFEPGAGGEHKLARGFEPALMHSAHWFAHPPLHAAMSGHLAREVEYYAAQVEGARRDALAFRSTRRDT